MKIGSLKFNGTLNACAIEAATTAITAATITCHCDTIAWWEHRECELSGIMLRSTKDVIIITHPLISSLMADFADLGQGPCPVSARCNC